MWFCSNLNTKQQHVNHHEWPFKSEGTEMSADTKIAELLTELHQLIKQTQVSLWRHAPARRSGRSVWTCVCLSGGEVTQRTQPAQHPEDAREDANGEQKSVCNPLWGLHPRDEGSIRSPGGALVSSLLCPPASPYYRTKLRGLYTTAKADAEAECRWWRLCVFSLWPKRL